MTLNTTTKTTLQIMPSNATQTYAGIIIQRQLDHLCPRHDGTIKNPPRPTGRHIGHEVFRVSLRHILRAIRHHATPRPQLFHTTPRKEVVHISSPHDVIPG